MKEHQCMDRSRMGVLRQVGIILLLVLPYGTLQGQATNDTMIEEFRAVKITNVASQVMFSDEAIEEGIAYLASIGINAILPVVQNGGYTQFPSEVMVEYFGEDKRIAPNMQGRDPLKVIIREAHRYGIEVYPWFEYGFASVFSGVEGPPNGGFIGATYPDWLARDIDGNICKKNGFDWISGINPDVQEFMLKLMMEVVRNYDIDGVEFSDRMPALPRECGYEASTVAQYRLEHDGADPSPFFQNAAWMRWRAGKLNDFYRTVRDSVKTYDEELFVASSPNVYPWGYTNYLQDSDTWLKDDIIDHFIPQIYRYNIEDYTFDLKRTLNDTPVAKRDIYFSGILMNIGSYTVTPEFLGAMIDTNRAYGVKGEGHFFYEGLRRNNNQLGTFLRENYYIGRTLIPGRNGVERRFSAISSSGDLGDTPGWITSDVETAVGPLYIWDEPSQSTIPNKHEFLFNVPDNEWYDIYLYTLADNNYADSIHITSFTVSDPQQDGLVQINDGTRSGWHKIGTFYMGAIPAKTTLGDNKVASTYSPFQIDASKAPSDKPIAIAGAIAVVNHVPRKLPSSIDGLDERDRTHPENTIIAYNYPNPFNPKTNIVVKLDRTSPIYITVFDVTGRKVTTLHSGVLSDGNHDFIFDATGLSSGIYIVQLNAQHASQTIKVLLLR
jgi:uncharacterized lipoprotein YddW (UPF0748 family)